MKNVKFKLVAWIGLLALYLAPIQAQAGLRSGILGSVDEGILPGWTIAVSTTKGAYVTSVRTDKDGVFIVDLKPGRYVVASYYVPHPGPGQPMPNFILIGPSKSVTVVPNHFTHVVLANSFGTIPGLPNR